MILLLIASIATLIFVILGYLGILENIYDWYHSRKYCVVCNGTPACWIPWFWDKYSGVVVDHPNVCKKHIEQVQRIGDMEQELFQLWKYD